MIALADLLPGFSVAGMICGFARYEPERRIVVATRSTHSAKKLIAKIRRIIPRQAERLSNRRDSDARIVVGNIYDAVRRNSDFGRRHYCFFEDARMLLWKNAQLILQQAARAVSFDHPYPRLVGIVTPDTTDHERRSLRQQLGCEVISQRRVSFERIGGGPQIRGKSPLQIKRDGIWRHPVRNRRIARLARSLDHQALILVENNEHRRQLRPLLPDDVIVTFQEAPPPEMTIVIRCDGGIGGLPNLVVDNSIRIFDFNDRHHPVLRNRSRQRRAAYQTKGWTDASV
jgi:hypothetical protein